MQQFTEKQHITDITSIQNFNTQKQKSNIILLLYYNRSDMSTTTLMEKYLYLQNVSYHKNHQFYCAT